MGAEGRERSHSIGKSTTRSSYPDTWAADSILAGPGYGSRACAPSLTFRDDQTAH
jgi:hypothetical protein